MDTHTRHHGNPNEPGKDPQLKIDPFAFAEEDAAQRRGVAAWFTRYKGLCFFPLLVGKGLHLHIKSQHLWRTRTTAGRRTELALPLTQFVLSVTAVF